MALLQTPSVKNLPATLLTGSPPQQEQQFNPTQMLGGFSAGLSGTLPQFMQAQNQTRQLDMQQQEIEDKKTEQRQATYFVDSAAMLNQLQNGNIDGALQIGLHRLQLLQGHKGVDPSDTQRLVMLAAGAKNGDAESADRLTKELSANVQLGQIYGVIPKPKPAEPIDANKINEAGQVPLYDAASGKITMQTVPGWTANKKTPEAMQTLQMRAQASGLQEGTPEYKAFMERGGAQDASSKMPESYQALLLRAKAAGLKEGSKEFGDFMARGGAVDSRDQPMYQQEAALRQEFNAIPVVKDFATQAQAMGRIDSSAKDPSAAGDLALIFSYMKVLDPGSTVREGEFANAQNAGGVGDKVVSMYNKVLNGERLSADQRKDFVDRSQRLYKGAEQGYMKTYNQYKRIAEKRGIDTENSIIDLRYKPEAQQSINDPLGILGK